MTTNEVITVAIATFAFILELVVAIVGGVWIVGKISGHTNVLSATIAALKETVESLRDWLGMVQDKVNQQDVTMGRVEERLDSINNRVGEIDDMVKSIAQKHN